MKQIKKKLLLALLLLLLFYSCKHKEDSGKLEIHFVHNVDNYLLETNKIKYTNAAGNKYEVKEVIYFISDLKLFRKGNVYEPEYLNNWHYINTNVPKTLKWDVDLDLKTGVYDSITFVFGLSERRNVSHYFLNPPESLMAWPEYLGGGYHYIMLNGFWINTSNQRVPFNFHLGIGRVVNNDNTINYVQNFFKVKAISQSFNIKSGINFCQLFMNIESWFETPHIYDHNVFGGAIMQNQTAIKMGCENGIDAFKLIF